jgi:hypothetical protein
VTKKKVSPSPVTRTSIVQPVAIIITIIIVFLFAWRMKQIIYVMLIRFKVLAAAKKKSFQDVRTAGWTFHFYYPEPPPKPKKLYEMLYNISRVTTDSHKYCKSVTDFR